MKVIKELLEAYTNYIQLPMILANEEGQLKYFVSSSEQTIATKEIEEQLVEVYQYAHKISQVSTISVMEEHILEQAFFFVSPKFIVENHTYFFLAGPFIRNPIREQENATVTYPLVEHEEVNSKLAKLQNLYEILLKKAKVETNSLFPKQLLEEIQVIGNFDREIADYDEYLKGLIEQLMNIDEFDFFGIAYRDEADIFTVKHVNGQQVHHLMDRRFYMGEGLLGKAAIIGDNFYWHKSQRIQRTEFFSRYGVFPSQLFGFVMKKDGRTNGIIFGGNFQERPISMHLLNILECIFRFVSQRKNITEKLVDMYTMQSIFTNWLDLMDIAANVKDRKLITYKILDFCHTLNIGEYTSFTSVNGDFLYRGEASEESLRIHQEAFVVGKINEFAGIWQTDRFLHANINFEKEYYGTLTIKFDTVEELHQGTSILKAVRQLIEHPYIESQSPKDQPFRLLFASLEDTNIEQFEKAKLSLELASLISEALQLTDEEKCILENCAQVLTYRNVFLAKHLSKTVEYNLLQDMFLLTHSTERTEDVPILVGILTFIYEVVIQNYRVERAAFSYLKDSVKERCIRIYQQTELRFHKLQRENNDTEQDLDLQFVLSKLSLTSREKEILTLILEGMNNQEVAIHLSISVHTVKNHVTNIFKKLNVSDRMQAMAKIFKIKLEN